jgi:hypothetical protein
MCRTKKVRCPAKRGYLHRLVSLLNYMTDYEQKYEDHWKDIIEPNGKLDMDAIKRELSDFSMVMEQVSKVYDHVTGGRISKVNTMASAVIGEADSHYEDIYSANDQAEPRPGERK